MVTAVVQGMAAAVGKSRDPGATTYVSFSETGFVRAVTSIVLTGVKTDDMAGVKQREVRGTKAGVLKLNNIEDSLIRGHLFTWQINSQNAITTSSYHGPRVLGND